MIGYLKYVVENCKIAADELCVTNQDLHEGMSADSTKDVSHLGALNRMIQDYLVMRVAGLFDKDTRTVSLHNALPENKTVKEIESEPIIKRIKENRNRFVAHSDFAYLKTEEFIIPTDEICSSNLRGLLEKLDGVLIEAESIN